MNTDILQGKWRELKGRVKEQWGKLTDEDLDVIEGRSERLVGLLQLHYGYAKDKAEEEYKRFVDQWSGNGGGHDRSSRRQDRQHEEKKRKPAGGAGPSLGAEASAISHENKRPDPTGPDA
jgi:uncharacterized protein YjbJ (UPF0337 family)